MVGEFGFFSKGETLKHFNQREGHDMTESLSGFLFVHLLFHDARRLFRSQSVSGMMMVVVEMVPGR